MELDFYNILDYRNGVILAKKLENKDKSFIMMCDSAQIE